MENENPPAPAPDFLTTTLETSRKGAQEAQAALEKADRELLQARLNLSAALGAVRALEYVAANAGK